MLISLYLYLLIYSYTYDEAYVTHDLSNKSYDKIKMKLKMRSLFTFTQRGG